MMHRNSFLEYMADLNKDRRQNKRTLVHKVMDCWLIKFAGIAFLFLLAKVTADLVASYCISIDLFTKIKQLTGH